MQIQSKQAQQSIDNIIKDAKKYRKLILIIQQTLYDLGYHQSAQLLQQQTNINYYTPQLLQIQNAIHNNHFLQAINILQSIDQQNNINSKQSILNYNQKINYNQSIINNKEELNNNNNNELNNNNNELNNNNNELNNNKEELNNYKDQSIKEQILNHQPNHNTIQQTNSNHLQNQPIKNNNYIQHITSNHNNISTINNLSSTNNPKLSHSSIMETKSMIYETYCLQKILNNEYQQAMKIISENIETQSQKQSLCQALILGNTVVTPQEIQKKKIAIFKFCLSQYQDIGQRQIQKVIQSYTQHQGQNHKQLKRLLSSNKKLPPMKLLSSQFQQSIKNPITHMKMNPITQQLIVIDQSREVQQITLLSFNEKNWQYQKQMSQSSHLSLKLKYPIFSPIFSRTVEFMYKGKKQSVEALAYNYNKQNPLIAVATFSLIYIFDSKLQTVATIQANNKIQKFIYLQFHPLSDLLYNCGYYESMQVIDSSGQQLMSIYPYPKTRKFLFYKSQIIGISLVTNKMYKHAIDQQVLTKERQLDEGAIPMDLCINEKMNKLSVSSIQFLYVIDSQSLQILGKTSSPNNPNKLIIECKFYGQFLLTLCKCFTAYQMSQDKLSQSLSVNNNTNNANNTNNNNQAYKNVHNNNKRLIVSKYKQWSGQGTFEVYDECMISGYRQIICWQSGDNDDMMQQQQLSQQYNNNNEIRDVQNIQLQVQDSDIQSNDIEQQDDESMDQQQQQDDQQISV